MQIIIFEAMDKQLWWNKEIDTCCDWVAEKIKAFPQYYLQTTQSVIRYCPVKTQRFSLEQCVRVGVIRIEQEDLQNHRPARPQLFQKVHCGDLGPNGLHDSHQIPLDQSPLTLFICN